MVHLVLSGRPCLKNAVMKPVYWNMNGEKGLRPEDIDAHLSSGKYDVFAMVHNETSTGVLSPLEPISELLNDKYPHIIWLVDAVSSMAGVKIETG